MRILGHFERFGPPVGGGILTTAAILRALADRGHTVQGLTNRPMAAGPLPFTIHDMPDPANIAALYAWAEIVVPHMTATPTALEYARRLGVPIVYPVHDDGQLDDYDLQPHDVALVIFNSTSLQQRTAWPGPTMVIYPPTLSDEHRVDTIGDAITIASMSQEKGAELFWELARRLPERRFIGVEGGWGAQIIPENRLPNVELWRHQGTDLRDVFQQTRILLAPSQQLGDGPRVWTENWGRAAIEAAASGIPTIATPTPGPLEALGDAGIFCERNDPDGWIRAIHDLDDPVVYQERSARVRRRAAELDIIVRSQLDGLDSALERCRQTPPRMGGQPTVG